jgi:conjugal transfer/entry exclusion protein
MRFMRTVAMAVVVMGIAMVGIGGVVIVMAVAMIVVRVAETLLAVEGQEQHAEAVEAGHEHASQHRPVAKVATQLFWQWAWISAASMMVSFE